MNNKRKKISEIRKEVYDKFDISEERRTPQTLSELTGIETDKLDYRKYDTWDMLLNRTYFFTNQNLIDLGIIQIIEKSFLPFISSEYRYLLPTIKAERERMAMTHPSEELTLVFQEEDVTHLFSVAGDKSSSTIIKVHDHHNDLILLQKLSYQDDADKQKRIVHDLQLTTNLLLDSIGIYDLRLVRIPCKKSLGYETYSFANWKQLKKLYGYEP